VNINNIIQLHSNSVAVVFSKMGINASVTKKDLLLALVMYKQPLIDAIGEQIEADEYTGYEGVYGMLPKGFESAVAKRKSQQGGYNATQTLPNVTITGKQKSQKAKGTLLSILDVLVTSAGAYAGSKNKAQAQSQAATYIPAAIAEDTKKKNQKYFLIAGAAIIILLIIVLLTQNNK
jgi:hypothetical protein